MEKFILLALVNAFVYYLIIHKTRIGEWLPNICAYCTFWWCAFFESCLLDITYMTMWTVGKAMAMTIISVIGYFYLKQSE